MHVHAWYNTANGWIGLMGKLVERRKEKMARLGQNRQVEIAIFFYRTGVSVPLTVTKVLHDCGNKTAPLKKLIQLGSLEMLMRESRMVKDAVRGGGGSQCIFQPGRFNFDCPSRML